MTEEKNNIVYDLLLVESDRVADLRREERDLYYLEPTTGEYKKVALAFDSNVESIKKAIFSKKKSKFFMTFNDTFDMEDGLRPKALTVARFFARQMNYRNIVSDMGINDISQLLSTHSKYITSSIWDLVEKDVIRFKVSKGRRTYMVNPVYYYRGGHSSMFLLVREYKSFPKHKKDDRKSED